MKTPRRSAFERCALASGLLTQDQLATARAVLNRSEREFSAPPATPWDQRLADKIVELGWLNVWQAKQLLEGRAKFNLGPYWIIDSIGRGGMGQVFKAEHAVLGRVVAIKVLPRNRSTPEAIASFTREIRAQAKLDHENLVRAYDAGEDGNVNYLVTEYVPGSDLRKLVRARGPLSMIDAAKIISQIASGLQYAHEQGVVHRDVKPGNILVTPEGHAKLSDLGLAGPLDASEETDPRFGRIVGTADYLSPDHIRCPKDPRPAWDIYSLGCTLYYAVTGKVPFPGGTTADKAQAHLRLPALDPRRLNPKLSDRFVDVIGDAMAKVPADRIAGAAEIVARLAPWTGVEIHSSALTYSGKSVDVSLDPSSESDFSMTDGVRDANSAEEDTESTFPELPAIPIEPKDFPSEGAEATQPMAAATEETSPDFTMIEASRTERGSLLGPLAVLVAFPSGVVGAILLIWWLLKGLLGS